MGPLIFIGVIVLLVLALFIPDSVEKYRLAKDPVSRRRTLQMQLASLRQQTTHLEEQIEELLASEQTGDGV